jgi:AcrR family transcriptional regulator
VTAPVAGTDFRPPQQARSRAARQRLLAAAEEVLVSRGLDDFTIAAVAEQAGVSVGGVYRRFSGKEQLLDAVIDSLLVRVEDTVTESLNTAEPSLAGVVFAFTHGIATGLTRSGRVASVLVGGQHTPESRERGLHHLTLLQRLFLDAAAPYTHQIARSARSSALTTALRTIIGAGAHRAATVQWWPDGRSWTQWADEIIDMTTSYLITPAPDGTPPPQAVGPPANRPRKRRTPK